MSKLNTIARIAANKIAQVYKTWAEFGFTNTDRQLFDEMVAEVAAKANVSYRRAKWAVQSFM